jgi:hypothetical protein
LAGPPGLDAGVHRDTARQVASVGSPAQLKAASGCVECRSYGGTEPADLLQCSVTGTDLSRVAAAAGLALEAGLTVWFSPHPGDLAGDDIVCYLAEAARAAEELRSAAGLVVIVAGCELSLFCAGYFPGATLGDRLDALTGAVPAPGLQASISELPRACHVPARATPHRPWGPVMGWASAVPAHHPGLPGREVVMRSMRASLPSPGTGGRVRARRRLSGLS